MAQSSAGTTTLEETHLSKLVNDQAQSVITNSLILMTSKGTTWMLAFALTIFLPRYLGEVAFGKLYFAISFTAIFTILVEFGLNSLVAREVAKDNGTASTYLINAGLIKFGLWVLICWLIFGVIQLTKYPVDTRNAVYILSFSIIIFSLSELMKYILQALNEMKYIGISAVAEKASLTILGLLSLFAGYGFVVIAFIILMSTLVGFSLNAYWLVRTDKFSFIKTRHNSFDFKRIRNLFWQAVPFFWVLGLGAIYFRTDVIMLSFMVNDSVVGWYGAAYRLFETLNFFPEVFMFALFPVLCQLSTRADSALQIAAKKGLNFLLIVGIPIAVGTYVLSDRIIYILYGQGFSSSIPVLRILSLTVIFLYTNAIVVRLLIATDRQKKLAITAGAAALLNISLNFLIIPHYQHLGAAATTLVTEVFVLAINLSFLPRNLLSGLSWIPALKALIAASAMGTFLLLSRNVNLLLLISAGALVYSMIIWVTRAFSDDDIMIIKSAFARSRVR